MIQFQPNFMLSMLVLGVCRLILKIWHLEIFVNTEPYGQNGWKVDAAVLHFWGSCHVSFYQFNLRPVDALGKCSILSCSKATPKVSFQPNFTETMEIREGYRLFFLAIWQFKKQIRHFGDILSKPHRHLPQTYLSFIWERSKRGPGLLSLLLQCCWLGDDPPKRLHS